MVHQDIKPSNIYLCDDDRVKILDFESPALRRTPNTQTGTMKGTLNYMAPERFSRRAVHSMCIRWVLSHRSLDKGRPVQMVTAKLLAFGCGCQ